MKSTKSQSIVNAVFALIVAVNAQLECQVFEDQNVVCTARDGDYVLSRGLVSDNNRYTAITLRNCHIIDVDTDAFENDFYLRYVDLSENKISNLQPTVLDGTFQLTHLNISYNWFKVFQPGVFVQKPNIEVLDLRGNQLNSLQENIFVPLRKLVYLDLSTNELLGRDLSPYIFDKNRLIKHLDLSSNDMRDSPNNLLQALTELNFLNLGRCSLKEIPHFATKPNLRTMRHLNLSMNQITSIDATRTLINLENLEILDLSDNFIEYFEANTFISLKKLKIIILRNNRLKTLPDGVFRNLANLEEVDLSHNLLEYVPHSAFFSTALKSLSLTRNRLSYLDAYFCLLLRNYGVRIEKLRFDDNPWQCACLNDILKELKTFNIEYSSAKYNGMHPVCVTTKIFTCKRHLVDSKLFLDMYYNVIM